MSKHHNNSRDTLSHIEQRRRNSGAFGIAAVAKENISRALSIPTVVEADKPLERYYLSFDGIADSEREITADQFVAAERNAGFYPKPGCGPFATSGFGGSGVRGRRAYV